MPDFEKYSTSLRTEFLQYLDGYIPRKSINQEISKSEIFNCKCYGVG